MTTNGNGRPKCRYHPRAGWIETEQRVPRFVDYTETRIELRCAIPGCPVVAEGHDPSRVNDWATQAMVRGRWRITGKKHKGIWFRKGGDYSMWREKT